MGLGPNSCQRECERECQSECQIECQNSCQMECQNVCLKRCQIECRNRCQIECLKECQVECQSICQTDCQIECQNTRMYIYIYTYITARRSNRRVSLISSIIWQTNFYLILGLAPQQKPNQTEDIL